MTKGHYIVVLLLLRQLGKSPETMRVGQPGSCLSSARGGRLSETPRLMPSYYRAMATISSPGGWSLGDCWLAYRLGFETCS